MTVRDDPNFLKYTLVLSRLKSFMEGNRVSPATIMLVFEEFVRNLGSMSDMELDPNMEILLTEDFKGDEYISIYEILEDEILTHYDYLDYSYRRYEKIVMGFTHLMTKYPHLKILRRMRERAINAK